MLEPSERLRNAIVEGNLSITKRLLFRFPELWLNIDYKNGWNNLHYSSYNGNYLICFHLISFINQFKDQNEDLNNILTNKLDMLTFDKLSPLHLTIMNEHLQTLHYLLTEFPGSYWINHQGGESLQTPLHFCCKFGFIEGLKLLLEKGADYNILDKHKNNLLHISFEFGKFECIKVIINYLYQKENGAKLIKSFENSKNEKGWLPVELSKNFKLTKLYKSFKATLLSLSNSSSSIVDENINLPAYSNSSSLFNNDDEFSINSNSPNKILASPIMSVNEFKRAHSQSLPTQIEPPVIRQRANTSIEKPPITPTLPVTPILKKTSSLKSLTISPSIRLNTENDHIDLDSTSSSTTTTTNSSPIKAQFPMIKTKPLKLVETPESPSSIAAKIAFSSSRKNSDSKSIPNSISSKSRSNSDSKSDKEKESKNSSPKKHKNSINSISFSRIR